MNMDSKQKPCDVVDSISDKLDPKDVIVTPAGFGVRGTGRLEEVNGIKHVRDFNMLGVSIVAESEPLTRIGNTVAQENETLVHDSVQPRARGQMPFMYHIDDFAFLPKNPEALEQLKAVNANPTRDQGYCVILTSDNQMIDCSEAAMKQKLTALGISESILNSDEHYSTARAMQQMQQEEKKGLGDVVEILPLGTGVTGVVQKRSFEYELIGGL